MLARRDTLHSTGHSVFRLEAQPNVDAHVPALMIGVDVIDTGSPALYRQALALLPEPSSPALVAAGLVVLAGLRRQPGRGRQRHPAGDLP